MFGRNGKKLLVVVHPGSACGSADFNMGHVDAAIARDALSKDIEKWHDDMIIVDGSLSDELDLYARLGLAIVNAGDRISHLGGRFKRIVACDMTAEQWPNLAVGEILKTWDLGSDDEIVITGAWVEPNDEGCVMAVHKLLSVKTNAAIRISDHALRLEE